MPLPFRRPQMPGLKATLVGAMLLTVGTTAAIVYVPWSLVSKRNIDTIVDQVNQEITLGTSQEVEKLFSNAESAQSLLNSSLGQNLVDMTNPQDRELFLLSVLQANPDFTWVQYGEPGGDFLGAQRTPDGQLHFHLRDWNGASGTTQTTVSTYKTSAEGLTPLGIETYEMDPPYFSPDRPWYRNTLASPQKRAWTVYVYRSTQSPGLDATTALINPKGEIDGVIGVGIELSQLSEYLQQLKSGYSGEAFIINAQRELIASTDVAEAVLTQGQDAADPRLQQLATVDNSLLRIASQTLVNQGVDLDGLSELRRFAFKDPNTGERYLISFTPLEQLDWVVGTVIPESSYLVEVNRNKRTLLGIIAVFTGLTAGVAVLMADRLIARPVLGIARTAADIEAEKFELGQLGAIARRTDEIGQLARVFDRMAQQVYSREQKLKQQVRDLRIEIDETKRKKQVKEIVETDFFQDLTAKAQVLRNRSSTVKTAVAEAKRLDC
ncbi:HAMP domain-containing protein [Nodosilinea sp. LEGE 07088]|uniref:HAMP domain-containing protein n=1 Tax=Nodosilinea sp. LEGE 07088 TaxID=2777968 RepID=UPI00188090A5|nr:cache domain-containing protein [Nodosilinea sp. LEGE 07088]MBE9137114.1 HAMP domain-containing protein [Nodosilinea sp. LEGE 07088]